MICLDNLIKCVREVCMEARLTTAPVPGRLQRSIWELGKAHDTLLDEIESTAKTEGESP